MPSVDAGQTTPVTQLTEPAAQPDDRIAGDCAAPVAIKPDLPGGVLSQGSAERLWGKDRAALSDCGSTKSKLKNFYLDRDEHLAGVIQPISMP